ncbi:MAG TPA: AmmeMemoRadiSam system protein B [Paludibacter sp.]|nr:AmmeMemoRadiSam system protein B [Paludibacter sp.]
MMTIDRKPAVAGQFYPADKDKLQHEVQHLLQSAEPKQCNQVRAIICPHAGYVYSGEIAASAFNQIDADANYKRIFLIASSHRDTFNNGAVYCMGNYLMPYGEVQVDTGFCKSLVEQFPDAFTDNPAPHQNEHSLEVQLPFLHYALKTNYRIVPIIIGTFDPAVCKRIARALKPYLNSENLFIISSDFSHYPEYADARQVDAITKDAILSNNPEKLLDTLAANSKKHIPNLETSLCGWTSVLTLLYMTSQNDSLEFHAIKYRNSGDAKYIGERNQVVGYWSIAVSEKESEGFQLSVSDKEMLLDIARKTIEDHCHHQKKSDLKTYQFSETLETKCGAFVSLHKKGALRGCIGLISSDMPLYKVIQEMTISACANDHRFRPVEAEELPDIDIEISVLSPLRKIEDISEIELGKHGILIEKYHRTGLFLPQVATETGWTKEEFLGHCARDKAGLDWDEWKSANIHIFTATVFK